MRQTVRFLNTRDEVTLAWAEAGRGPPLIRASNWLTHLEYDWRSPVWRRWTEFLANHFRQDRPKSPVPALRQARCAQPY